MDKDALFLAEIEPVKQVEFQFETLVLNDGFQRVQTTIASTPVESPNYQRSKIIEDVIGQKTKTAGRKKKKKLSERDSDDDDDGDNMPNRSHKYSKRHRKKMVSKKYGRRHENFCCMLNIVYGDSLTDDEFEFEENEDLVNRDSPFSRVILNEKNLKIWIDFVSMTGQEQEDFLDSLDDDREKNDEYKRNGGRNQRGGKYRQRHSECLDSTESSGSEYENEFKLKIAHFSYCRIDKNIREVIKKESSIDCVEKYENEVISAFSAANDQHRIQNIMCSFERMVLHGLCQYLDIRSKSFNDGVSVEVRMELNEQKFRKPPILLSEFLKRKVL